MGFSDLNNGDITIKTLFSSRHQCLVRLSNIRIHCRLVAWGTVLFVCCLFLFYAIATVFQIYHSGDMMCEMRRRKPEPTHLPTWGIFNLPHHIGMLWVQLAFDDDVSYIQWVKWIAAQLNVIAMTGIRAPVSRMTYPALQPTELTPNPDVRYWHQFSINVLLWNWPLFLAWH